MGDDVVWGERKAGEVAAIGKGGEVILDTTLSPDWIRIPDMPVFKHHAGNAVRVCVSLWFGVAPNPRAGEPGEPELLDVQCRYHLLGLHDIGMHLVAAEVPGGDCMFTDIGKRRWDILLESHSMRAEEGRAGARARRIRPEASIVLAID